MVSKWPLHVCAHAQGGVHIPRAGTAPPHTHEGMPRTRCPGLARSCCTPHTHSARVIVLKIQASAHCWPAPRTPITDANTRCFSAPPHRPCAVCLSARALKSAVFAWAHGWSARSGLCGMGRATALCWARAAPEACPATRTHHDTTSAGGLLGMQGGGGGGRGLPTRHGAECGI